MPKPGPLPIPGHPAHFSVRQALAAGATRRRLRAADLQAPFWGIRSTPTQTLTALDRCTAFMLRMPQDAVYSHVTAAQVYGMPLPRRHEDGPLHVGTPGNRRPVRAVGVIGHRLQLRQGDCARVRRLPVTSPERTWLDLGALLSLRDLVAAGDQLVRRAAPLTTIADLGRAFDDYSGRRGVRMLRAALPLLDEGSESARESWLRVMLIEAGFPRFETNQNVFDASGNFVARVDLLNRRYRVALEYEGDQHRADRRQWQRDVGRLRAVQATGLRVIRVTADDLYDPTALFTELGSYLPAPGDEPR
ncbi:MAG TPA: hypothetical protein VN133_03670 [Humibacter sp.]|nr:hypothetical protein [Humibacter sp.]